MSRRTLAIAAIGLALVIGGCQSTQDKSAELAKQGGVSVTEKGLEIAKRSREVKVARKAVLDDPNGIAAIVELRNTGKRTLVNVPIAIDVLAKGKKVFSNDAPGLERSLVSVAVLEPGESLAWVNDQVFAAGPKLKAVVGATSERAPAKLPEIDVSPPKLGGDPTSGIAVEGRVANRSEVLQRKLVIYAVARRGGRIVAAGRGQIERLKPGASAGYQIFFIGNPEGAQVELAAPPTTFQ